MFNEHLSLYIIAAQSFDKAMLTFSIASLGFTFAFLEVYRIGINYKPILICSWCLFVIAILCILITFIFLQYHALHRVGHYSKKYLMKKNYNGKSDHWTDCFLGVLQWLSLTSFVGGLVMFTVFVALNIK